MSLNSINSALAGTYGAYNQKLTQATKNELDKLGIAYEQNMTESQGKALIAKAKQAQNNNSNNLNQNNNQQNDLFKRAQKLASELGIQIDEKQPFKSVISLIEQALQTKITQNENNPAILEKLKGYSQELAFIQAQSNGSAGYENTNKALMNSLEILSKYNKSRLFGQY